MVLTPIRGALAILLLTPTIASATDNALLSLADAIQMAVSQSRLLDAGKLQASSARAMAIAAEQLPDPVLKMGINNLPINGEDRFSLTRDFMTMRSIGVMQEFTREDKRRARSLRFEKEAETAEADRALSLNNIQRNVAMAWLDRYYQERITELLVRQRDEAKLQIEAADAAYRGGRGSQSDVFASRSAIAQIEDRIAMSERIVTTTQTQLARWIGKAAERNLDPPPALDTVHLNESHLDAQLQTHPHIAVYLKREEMARADADIARANKKADWNAELMFSQRGSAYSKMVSLTLSIPLQWDQKNRQDRELASKLATVEQLQAEREDVIRSHIAEARQMLQEWRSNRDRLKRYDDSIVPLAAQSTHAAITAYRAGGSLGGTLNAVLEARRAEIDVRIERLRLEMDTARLWTQINYFAPTGE